MVKEISAVSQVGGNIATIYNAAFSPGGKVLICTGNASSSLNRVYAYRVGSWTSFTTPGFNLGTVYAVAFSPDGKNVFLGRSYGLGGPSSQQLMYAYSFDEDAPAFGQAYTGNLFSSSSSSNVVYGIDVHPKDKFVAITRIGSVAVYPYDPDLRIIGASITHPSYNYLYRDVKWHPSGRYIAAAIDNDNKYIAVWEWESPNFIRKLSDPSILPTGSGRRLAWSSDGRYLAITHLSSPYITVYEFDAETGTIGSKLSNPSVLPAATGQGVAFLQNDRFLAVAHSNAPYFTIWEFDAETGTIGDKLDNPALLPGGNGVALAGHPGGNYFIVGATSSSGTIYQGLVGPGLLFKDPIGHGYLTDEEGKFIQRLKLGRVHASTPVGNPVPIVIENTTGATATNVVFNLGSQHSPDEVQVSLTEEPFAPESLPIEFEGSYPTGADIATLWLRVVVTEDSQLGENKTVEMSVSADLVW